MSPPDNALVFCVDEKSQIQALERSQPMLPMRAGRPQRRSHDYFRHGTTSLFAALDVATGRVIASTKARHRSRGFLAFLRQIERFFALLTNRRIRRDSFATLAQLKHAIAEFIDIHNADPKPFVWTRIRRRHTRQGR